MQNIFLNFNYYKIVKKINIRMVTLDGNKNSIVLIYCQNNKLFILCI